MWFNALVFLTVTPAKAGVQGAKRDPATLDPGFRRDDERRRGTGIATCDTPTSKRERGSRPYSVASRSPSASSQASSAAAICLLISLNWTWSSMSWRVGPP
jgi:hypothetical protein